MNKSVESALDDLSKSGEGTRGGKVIGHTSSGKPIYQSGTNAKYKTFSGKEHHEAYVAHSVMGNRALSAGDHEGAAKHGKQQAYHRGSFEAHESLGAKLPSYDQSLGRVKLAKAELYSPDKVEYGFFITKAQATVTTFSKNGFTKNKNKTKPEMAGGKQEIS
jgi:hypothetical protein